MRAFTGTLAAGALIVSASSIASGAIIVESRTGGQNFAAYTNVGVFPNAWSDTTEKSTASDLTAGIGSRFNSNSGVGGAAAYFQVAPTLDTAGGTYLVEITHGESNAGTTVVSTVTVTNGTLTGTDADAGLAGFQTNAFSSAVSNAWETVGTLTLNAGQTTPTVRFDETANNNRFIADAVRFTLVPVPEPAAIGLVSLMGLGMLSRRPKR